MAYDIGTQFGRLTIKEQTRKNNRVYYLCECECGNEKLVRSDHLKSGATVSCGCLQKEKVVTNNTKHGLHDTPIYSVWEGMKQRCYNPNAFGYENYGGRGITVCDEWLDFESFYTDMFPTYKKGLQLDRKNNDEGYSKDNCHWVSRKVNNLNKRTNHLITFKGETLPLSEMARKYGHTAKTVDKRLKIGWSLEKALTEPKQERYVRGNK